MDGKGKPRGEVSDVAQQSGGRRIDGSLKGEDGRKKSVPANWAAPRFMWCCIITRPPQEMGKLEQCDACGLVRVCVRARVCLLYRCPATLLLSVLTPFICPPKQTDFPVGQRALGCGEVKSPTFTLRLCSSLCGNAVGEKSGSDHPGLSSQSRFDVAGAYGLCAATLSAETHSQNAVLLPPVWRRRRRRRFFGPSRGMHRWRERAASRARRCQAGILGSYGHPGGEETCPV